ncbi:hypothetical protein [Streptomyces sp. NPDC001933]|uniref:hypothetical protein n=1 Tax=Streptomyces sp. NPDC001933 TaxID=3364626 RepID=UPI003696EE78
MDISTGGNAPDAKIETGPHYQVPFAERVRKKTGMPATAVGLNTEPDQTQDANTSGQADTVLLGHELLRNPHWARHATPRRRRTRQRGPLPRPYHHS